MPIDGQQRQGDAARGTKAAAPGASSAAGARRDAAAPAGGAIWQDLRQHKVVEWTLAYTAAGFAFVHGIEMAGHAFEWPTLISRVSIVAWLAGVPVAATVAWYHGARARSRVSRTELSILILLLLLAGSALWLLARPGRDGEQHAASTGATLAVRPPTAESSAQATPPSNSIAVLPLSNLSGDPTQEYFSDGMTEELINALSQIDSLQVTARTSSFSFKGQSVDIRTIAGKLNVSAVLEGSIRRSGATVRVTVQLINALSGFQVWSQSYDRNLHDVLELQTEIAAAVAHQLQARLTRQEAARIEAAGTRNPQAYDAYLRGVQLLNFTDSRLEARSALSAFDQALALDPSYAAAHAQRARALRYISDYSVELAEQHELYEMARTAAERAVQLAPESADAHAVLGWYIKVMFLDYRGAARELERARELAPGSAFVLHAYSQFHANMGHAEIALRNIRRAISLDPQNYVYKWDLGNTLYASRRFEQIPAIVADLRRLKPDGTFADLLAYSYLAAASAELARGLCESPSTPMSPRERPACLALAYHALGRRTAAERELEQLKSMAGDTAAYDYAGIYAQWGDHPAALQWLERAESLRRPDLLALRVNWMFDPIRNDPGFKTLERRLDFPP